MFEIKRYTPSFTKEWNLFVETSRNGTFLFDRNYMDYHADRFADHSLLFYKDHALYALLPANIFGTTLYSHQGLTYGGLILDYRATAKDIIILMEELNAYLRKEGFQRVVYKCIPWIYQQIPTEEDLYAMFRVCKPHIAARDIASVVTPRHPVRWKRDRRYGANKARTEGIQVEESHDLETFWQILNDNLTDKYGVGPVHSLAEMQLLQGRFPNNIRLYAAMKDGQMLGGTLLYITPQTIHAQYISATPEGKHYHAIDAIYSHLIHQKFKDVPYLDFGKSTESNGDILNESLIYQKEGFGGRGVCYDWYEWTP